jgi:hypothetical protein
MPARAVPPTEDLLLQNQPLVPVSIGELIDKITILELKQRHIDDPAKRANVDAEYVALHEVLAPLLIGAPAAVGPAIDRLRGINGKLWQIEDDIRDCERDKDFGPRFVALARAVYVTNDERAAEKRELNQLLGSRLVEEKSYKPYA